MKLAKDLSRPQEEINRFAKCVMNYENVYVDKIILGGKVYDKNYITHTDLMKGGKLQFDMTKTPNKSRGTLPESFPYSFSNKKN